ncbi:hypothetical protein IV102_00945 [bacterium]|nr:hypothetical protein [bacterium]
MKQILEPIEVRAEFTPNWRFRWRQRVYLVTQVSQRWYYRGKWWLDPQLQGECRNYFRVICRTIRGERGGGRPMESGPYSLTRYRNPAPQLGDERVVELFQRCRPQGNDWVLSKLVD